MTFSLTGQNFQSIVYYVLDVLYILVPIMFAVAFIVFFWGLSKFILNSGNKDAMKDGRKYMLWGVLVLFILISFRAIIVLVSNELEFGQVSPLLPSSGSSSSKKYLPVIEPNLLKL